MIGCGHCLRLRPYGADVIETTETNPTTFAIVLTTCGSREEAGAIAHMLVERQLAACVQLLAIESVYRWKEAVEEAAEVMLICKIKRESYACVEAEILRLHSYETPEVVMLPIEQGTSAYLQWMAGVTR